ncbi:sugar phosphate isomerase/epimerase family protein [Histidinibacterium aquaticum]|uniref:TIM barrel protein n=1 Tax=Histidinibacterium aquaticum TaxID=2613962 RepID=A0A5J5GMN9_9RHOB|nr:sugar phosphate isomerase/epimerase family protein [Histidinibacterium aquaticum]KAA9008752.1 TIM barrel protein [Histidinibacterium aquaticum]
MAQKNSVLMGTLGKYSDRFHTYQPARDYAERIEVAKTISGADGIEPVYPHDLGHDGEMMQATKDCGMAISAVNVNLKGEDLFRAGSFTNPDAGVRQQAISYMKRAMDMAAELGTDMISVCPLIDGSDHAFHVDHFDQWRWTIDAFGEVTSHRDDVRVSIEYKAYEVRNRIILPSMGRTLHLCDRVGAANLGVTMDLGHALIEGECAAAEIAAAHEAGRLFYVHFNDNDRNADWDMPVASINLWDTLEVLWYMERIGYDGWIAYDVFTRAGDGVEAVGDTFETMNHLRELLAKIGPDKLKAMVAAGSSARTTRDLIKALL